MDPDDLAGNRKVVPPGQIRFAETAIELKKQ